ncbi:MAG TPA: VOC family protein [Symbiobacteriaceae bacterium]|jgi:predicted 3-demethylubiquinone-9 3-methyltransferase (glyoxalase superfamily)|nr:VOC family protein [Symbiobacteriaceae bacterium]
MARFQRIAPCLWFDSEAEAAARGPCGWLKDRFGLSWQITPTMLEQSLTDPDPERTDRVMAAMFQMRKLDIAALQRAYDGE